MLRLLRFAFLGLLGLGLLVVALANRAPVTLRLLQEDTGSFLGLGWSVSLPLFVVIFAGILAGLMIGFVWEWFRESKHRAAAAQHRREAAELKHQMRRLSHEKPEPKDEVLALLEGSGPKR